VMQFSHFLTLHNNLSFCILTLHNNLSFHFLMFYIPHALEVYMFISTKLGLLWQVGKCVEIGILAFLFILLFSQVKC
jgi:hypothetical protein